MCVHVHGHACPSTCGYCSAPSRFSLLGRESADSIWKSSSAFDSAPRASRRRRLGPARPCAVRLCVCTHVCLYACARACAVAASQPTPSATALARSVFAGAQCLLEPGRWHSGEGEGHTLCSASPLSPEVSRAPSSWGRQTRAVHSVAGAPSRSRSQRAVSGVGERTAFSAAVENSLRVILVKARPASINRNFQSVLKVREWTATTNKTQTPPSVCWGSQNDLLGNL